MTFCYVAPATAGAVLVDAADRVFLAGCQRDARARARELGLARPRVERVRPSSMAALLTRAHGQEIARAMRAAA